MLQRHNANKRLGENRPSDAGPSAEPSGGVRGSMRRTLDYLWPAIGLVAVVVSVTLLVREFRGESVAAGVLEQFTAITPGHYALAILSALFAYAALAYYDRLALLHLGISHVSMSFVAATSFTTYALSHTVGASVLSGAVIRYRAYSTQGLSATQIGVLVALCSITFLLGTLLLGGAVLLFEPGELRHIAGMLPRPLTDVAASRIIGIACLGTVVVYVLASALRLKPVVIRGFRLVYPRPAIVLRQFVTAPLELLGAAGIIYFALPEAGNPGFLAVLAIFLGSFTAALASNAPGGAGVFELLFINALPAMAKPKVLAAILVFRLFYFLIPLALAVVVIVLFERRRLDHVLHREPAVPPATPSPMCKKETAGEVA